MDRKERLEELLAEAHERAASGEPFDADSFARAHPDFADDLRAHLRILPMADRVLGGAATAAERERVRGAVRRLLAADAVHGRIEEPAHYKNLFPGFWDVVDEECRKFVPPGGGAGGDPASRTLRSPLSTPAPVFPASDTLGSYRVLRELGRGGMGVVYLAEDTRLHRRVAVKVLSPAFATSGDLQKRFQREAAVASRLDHPGISTVFEAGEASGTAFIAMKYVPGETLEHWINVARSAAGLKPGPTPTVATIPRPAEATPLPAPPPAPGAKPPSGGSSREEILRLVHLVEKAARALHVAHEAGLIHRDIKPGNIMVTPEGEPVVLDFGLAREEEGATHGITQTGALMGTPAYMSPEQIAAQRIKLDRRTDVYSLGVTLYEALTLRLPFSASSRDSLYQKILVTEPENPRRLNPSIPPDLKVVLDKVLEKNRDRRYPTALEFGEDLRRVRAFEPVHARPISTVTRVQRWVQRNPGVAIPSACLAVLVLVAPPSVLFLMERVKQGVREDMKRTTPGPANPQLSIAESALRLARQQRKEGRLAEAQASAETALSLTIDTPEFASIRVELARFLKEVRGE